MLRTILALALTSAAAIAAEKLPIAGLYGNASGCAMATKGPDSAPFDSGWIVISPTGIQGHALACSTMTAGKETAVLSCSGAGGETPGKQVTVTFHEYRNSGILHWNDGADPPLTLDHCK